MAGQRRGQYVSIPLGPGVLSNTTGRGAKTRQNYMTYDRWFDATWVRWHKILPEKQGGWAYQQLSGAAAQPPLVVGSPALLLHMNGANGSTVFPDSSVVNNVVTPNGATSVDTGTPKFGTGAANFGNSPSFNSLTVPISVGGPLDLIADCTIEVWVLIKVINGGNVICDYLGGNPKWQISVSGPNFVADFGYSGTSQANVTNPTVIVVNTWYEVALVVAANVVTLYVNGIASIPASITGPRNPTTGVLTIGGSSSFGTCPAMELDEVRITPKIALYISNFTPATVENTLGTPNTLGTVNPPNAFGSTQYLGLARDLHDWSSIDGQYWIAIGTHLKLYVVNQATLYDITPDRKTSNVMNALTTTNASAVVTVTDPGHQANTGDFVDITGATAVGGLTIAGGYPLTVVDPSTYTIIASANATSGATGGGSFSIAYELSVGLPANGQLLGYGTGPYGIGTYGTPRPAGTGIFARMRTWSLDNYGQDFIASPSDGGIYWWQKNSGPNSPAALLENAPDGCQRVIVDAQQHVIIALGCTDVTSTFNAMLVRWCSFNNITDWFPTSINTAGDDLLTAGSRIVTGLKTKGQNLIFTDTTLYRMVFVGQPDIYDFIPAGAVTIVGPNAAVDVDGVAYFMGFDNIYNYSGTLNLQACDVWETVFDPNFPTSLNRAQSEGVVCYTFEPKTEVTWLYQSIGGAFVVAFTAGLAQSATSATLASPWAGQTGVYDLQFSDQESFPVVLTKGQTTATWGVPLTAAVAASATFIGNDRYVTFNWEDGVWYDGAWNRTCAMGRAPAMGGFPYGVNGGYLYQHEVGTDAVEAAGTQAIGFSMRSLDITVGGAKSEYTMGGSDARFAFGGSDAHLLLRSMLPDWKYMTGAMNLTIFTKDRPQDATYVQEGPVAFTSTTSQIDIDAHGSQLVIQLDNFTAAGGAPSLGSSFRSGIWQGLAVPYAKR